MTEWRELRMRDVMAEFYDGPHATPSPADAGPIYLGIKNISEAGLLDLSETRHIAPQDFAKWTKRVTPQAGDVVFVYEATLHRYALIPDHFVGCLGRRLALIRPNRAVILPRFLHFYMLGPTWRETVMSRIISGATVDRIPIIDFPEFPIAVPDLDTQQSVVDVLGALDDLIENNRRRIELLDQMAQAIYREWFVYLRFPGHTDVTLVDSLFGRIPEGWDVMPVAAVATSDRNAVTGGPFGSKLGRKDYVDEGVPVVRGANLRLGGGFDETDLVFVTDEKANELRSSLARRGDVLVTQRGTLGQVGLIPTRSRWDRYLMSQSQMKITVDPVKATTEFVYGQLRTAETTSRFIAMAMSSGVPHVNLRMLREFEIVVPPFDLQARFSELVIPLFDQAWMLSEQRRRIVDIRDLLLPKLVTGQIDLSSIDLGIEAESVA